MTAYTTTYEPLMIFGRVSYDSDGELQSVDIGINHQCSVTEYASQGDHVGDVFERAFERAKVLMLTTRHEGTRETERPAGPESREET